MSVSARFDDSVPPLAPGEEEEAESRDGKEGVSAEDVMHARARCIRLTARESLVTAQLLVALLSFFYLPHDGIHLILPIPPPTSLPS